MWTGLLDWWTGLVDGLMDQIAGLHELMDGIVEHKINISLLLHKRDSWISKIVPGTTSACGKRLRGLVIDYSDSSINMQALLIQVKLKLPRKVCVGEWGKSWFLNFMHELAMASLLKNNGKLYCWLLRACIPNRMLCRLHLSNLSSGHCTLYLLAQMWLSTLPI